MKRTAWCVVVLSLACLAGSCQKGDPPSGDIVYLGPSRHWILFPGEVGGVRPLAREIVRQAFLQSARDELGLTTRDARLGDPMPTQGDNAPWDVVVSVGTMATVKTVRGFGSNQTEYASHEFGPSTRSIDEINYRALTELEESLSRTTFTESLKKAGFRGKSNKLDETIVVPEAVETLLGEMNLLSQFRALRELHAIARDQGESSAILGALSRGYANLGVMTEFQWNSGHRVFKARSLLYAQRMLARKAKSPLGPWHRAYAAALAGLPEWAESDLRRANAAWQMLGEKERPTRPAWVELIEPLCRYQVDALDQQVKDPKIGALAAMLKFKAVDNAGGQTWLVQTAIQTLEKTPECYHVHDRLCEFGGVSALHAATIEPIRIAGTTLYGRLDSMPGIPETVRDIVQKRMGDSDASRGDVGLERADFTDEFKSRGQLVEALMKTGELPTAKTKKAGNATIPTDGGEPSWVALGILIRDLSFMQVFRRANFERYCLDVPTEEWLAMTAPLVENHPYKPFLETFAWESDKVKDAAARLSRVDPTALEQNASCILRAFKKSDPAYMIFTKPLYDNMDFTVRDFVAFVRQFQGQKEPAVQFSKGLTKVSPDNPFARAVLVDQDWEHAQTDAAEWDKMSASYPHLSSVLGARYTTLGRWDDAERCLKAAIKVVPGESGYYQKLAQIYKMQGKTDRWLATLEEYLRQPDYGLAHFQVRSDIAYHFMSQKEWEKALPYAEGAAEAYSGWGLLCAANCHEGLQRWDEAEKFYRAASERYRGCSLSWYFFCRRTGEGDLEASQRLAREYVKNLAKTPGEPNLFDLTTFYLLEDQPDMAMQKLEEALVKNSGAGEALWLALIAEQCKDVPGRDRAMNRVRSLDEKDKECDNATSPSHWAVVLADLITKDIAAGGKGKIDLDAADKIAAPLDGLRQAWLQYFLAQYLGLHGQQEAANRYGKRCMGWTGVGHYPRTLAGVMLVKNGIKPADYKSLLQPDPKDKANEKKETNEKGTEKVKEEKKEKEAEKAKDGEKKK